MSAFVTYPPIVTLYAAVNAGPLNISDTESQFNLNGPASTSLVDNAVAYTLPGLPFNVNVIPTERLLKATLSSGGSALIGPPDYNKQPRPELGDFRCVFLRSIGDFALVQWTGFLWTLVETGGPTVAIATLGQNPL